MLRNPVLRKARITMVIPVFLSILSSLDAQERRPLAGSGGYARTIEHLRRLVPREMSRCGIKGLSIALVDDQTVAWAEGFGWAVRSKGIRVTKDTLFQIGSISKIFTAMAAMKLVEEGKLDIEQPVSRYIENFEYKRRFDAPEPKVRHLMYHHAGLPSENLALFFSRTKAIPLARTAELLADEYAAYPPDFVYSYSNLGVTLVGHILQNVVGEDFVSYTDRALFVPMGMHRTSFSHIPKDAALMSRGYLNGKESDHYICNCMPAASVISSAAEMAEFIKTINAGGVHGGTSVLKPATLARMFQAQNAHVPLDFDLRIGLGWFLSGLEIIAGARPNYPGTVAWHAGDTLLYKSMIAVIPELRLGVVVLTNSNTGDMASARIAVEALNRAIEEKAGISAPAPARKKPPRIRMDPDELRSYAGYYATEYFGAVKVTTAGRRACMRIAGFPLKMTFYEGRVFDLSFLGIRPSILKDRFFSFEEAAGRKLLLMQANGKKYLMGVRIEPEPVPAAWRKRCGAYAPVDTGDALLPFTGVAVDYRDGLIFVDYRITGITRMVPGLVLQPISDTEALTAGLGRHMGQTVRIINRDGQEVISGGD